MIGFGFVSLLADMVYEGARSLYGPALLALGASAATVGLVAGAGEAMALMLRLVAGPVADRRGAHWSFTIVGYALTAVCVPLMAVAPRLGAAGLVAAAVLILLERAGKAVRSPSKSALLAHAAKAVGRGTGFGVHKALDQTGAFAGPLLVAAVVAVSASLWWGYAALAVPGAAAMAVLLLVRARVPDPTVFDPQPATGAAPSRRPGTAGAWWSAMLGARLGSTFFRFAVAAALTTGGLVSFALVAVHLTRSLGVQAGMVPVVYAGAMLVEAVAALVTGRLFDRVGAKVLVMVPLLVAVVPPLVFGPHLGFALAGVACWAAAVGVQDSTIKALVADLVPARSLAGAYGVFAAVQGAFAVVGGVTAGWLLDRSVPALAALVGVTQLASLILLVATLRGLRPATR